MRAASVGGDVAAQLGLLGGAGVGWIEEPVLAGAPANVGGDGAGFNRRAPQAGIEVADLGQPLEAEHDPAVERDGAAGEPGATPARDDRHVVLVAPGDGFGDLLRVSRERDRVGPAAQVSALRGVTQVSAGVARQDAVGSEERRELALDRGAGSCCHGWGRA